MKLFEKIKTPAYDKKLSKLKNNLKQYIRKNINNEIYIQASKMNVNIDDIFTKMVFSENPRRNAENVVSHLAGIVGSVKANKYFKDNGYIVLNEIDIASKNEIVTVADLVLKKDNKTYYCELKTIPQLLLDKNNFNNNRINKLANETIKREDYHVTGFDARIIYASSGNKLLKQVQLLKENTNGFVKVLIFDGTYIDKELKKELLNYSSIEVIPENIDSLFAEVSEIVNTIYSYGVNLLSKHNFVPNNRK